MIVDPVVVAQRFREHHAKPIQILNRSGRSIRKASVLVPLFLKNGCVYILLTRRSLHLRSHGGEVALPGGKRDETDVDDVHTALRETHEEIGLEPEKVQVIGFLEPMISKAGILVTPVVGLISGQFTPIINEDEVHSVFSLPLEYFLCDYKLNHTSSDVFVRGLPYVMHFFTYDHVDHTTSQRESYLIWGLTAQIVIRAAEVCFARPAAFQVVESSRSLTYDVDAQQFVSHQSNL